MMDERWMNDGWMIEEGLNLDNRNFESVTDFHSVCYVYGRLGGRNRLFRAQVR
jgi:hypothetical protein